MIRLPFTCFNLAQHDRVENGTDIENRIGFEDDMRQIAITIDSQAPSGHDRGCLWAYKPRDHFQPKVLPIQQKLGGKSFDLQDHKFPYAPGCVNPGLVVNSLSK